MKDSSHKRHIAKAITWRIIGTLDTFLLSWWITSDLQLGLQIGLAEIISKIFLYYLHERIWYKAKTGAESHLRHVYKTMSWRIVGTVDTMILAWIISGNPMVGLKVGLIEVVTKMILYYLHERTWYRINYGLKQRNSNPRSIGDE